MGEVKNFSSSIFTRPSLTSWDASSGWYVPMDICFRRQSIVLTIFRVRPYFVSCLDLATRVLIHALMCCTLQVDMDLISYVFSR